MTHIEQAIRDAVERGGYACGWTDANEWPTTFLDPAFWQALGKARGWKETTLEVYGYDVMYTWAYQQHRFISHLADRKEAESFFASLV